MFNISAVREEKKKNMEMFMLLLFAFEGEKFPCWNNEGDRSRKRGLMMKHLDHFIGGNLDAVVTQGCKRSNSVNRFH